MIKCEPKNRGHCKTGMVCWERRSCESSSNASWDKLSGSPYSPIVPFIISFSVPVRKVKEQEEINLNAGAKEF